MNAPTKASQAASHQFKVGIVGASGYTGAELLRLLSHHPNIVVHCITSRAQMGLPIRDIFPHLHGYPSLCFDAPDDDKLNECDVIFYATPHGVAMNTLPQWLAQGKKIIDLSADYRIQDTQVFETWYQQPHSDPNGLSQAVYGLTEQARDAVAKAQLVANPGCYPTSIQLPLIPLLQADLIEPCVIADSKSGVSGAGRQASIAALHTEVSENFQAYKASGHRHLPEIEQGLVAAAGTKVDVTFVPHLLPINRGILSTIYVKPTNGFVAIQDALLSAYQSEHFVEVKPVGFHPQTAHVRGSNQCHIGCHQLPNGQVVIISVIDNLIKGASGQAIQNMNLMLGLAETTGLLQPGFAP